MMTMNVISNPRWILLKTRRFATSFSFVCLLSLFSCVSCRLWLEDEIETYREKKVGYLESSFTSRILHSTAVATCEEDAEDNEANLADIGLDCDCRPRRDGVVLICLDDCAYCNDDQTVCGIQSAQALYEHDTGERSAVGGVFQYVTGRRETIAVENLGCVEENGQIVSCEVCNVYVNGKACNSCEIVDCGNGGMAEFIDCENIERGATFDFCNPVEIDDGIFQALATDSFEECLPLEILHVITGKGRGKGKGGKRGKAGGGGYYVSEDSSSSSSSYSRSSDEYRRPYYGEGKAKGKGNKKSAKKRKSRRGLVRWLQQDFK